MEAIKELRRAISILEDLAKNNYAISDYEEIQSIISEIQGHTNRLKSYLERK